MWLQSSPSSSCHRTGPCYFFSTDRLYLNLGDVPGRPGESLSPEWLCALPQLLRLLGRAGGVVDQPAQRGVAQVPGVASRAQHVAVPHLKYISRNPERQPCPHTAQYPVYIRRGEEVQVSRWPGAPLLDEGQPQRLVSTHNSVGFRNSLFPVPHLWMALRTTLGCVNSGLLS